MGEAAAAALRRVAKGGRKRNRGASKEGRKARDVALDSSPRPAGFWGEVSPFVWRLCLGSKAEKTEEKLSAAA